MLKKISPEYSLEGLRLKLKLSYFGHLMQREDSLDATLRLGKIEGRRRRGDRGWDNCMASLTQWTWVWANSWREWRTEKPGVLRSVGWKRVRHNLVTEQQQTKILPWPCWCHATRWLGVHTAWLTWTSIRSVTLPVFFCNLPLFTTCSYHTLLRNISLCEYNSVFSSPWPHRSFPDFLSNAMLPRIFLPLPFLGKVHTIFLSGEIAEFQEISILCFQLCYILPKCPHYKTGRKQQLLIHQWPWMYRGPTDDVVAPEDGSQQQPRLPSHRELESHNHTEPSACLLLLFSISFWKQM